MKIKEIKLSNFKCFSSLTIADIPESAKLIVLVGPNGSGKSSVFDALLLKKKAAIENVALENGMSDYYDKEAQESRSTHDAADRVTVSCHDGIPDYSRLYVRSAYRAETDFSIQGIELGNRHIAQSQINRIIDVDRSVSENYKRLAQQCLDDVISNAPGDTTLSQYRSSYLNDLQRAIQTLFPNPKLILHGVDAMKSGAFRFRKGSVESFHYKNLSGGEKAAFDILLDIFVKRNGSEGTAFCIDEPELHIATYLQGQLVKAMMALLPSESQLWIATHSIGIIREAQKTKALNSEDVVFLNFFDQNCDGKIHITPHDPDNRFWRRIYDVTLHDLAALVVPECIFLCEGSRGLGRNGFDATCYERLFEHENPDSVFISRGGSKEVTRAAEEVTTVFQKSNRNVQVFAIIDRDEKGTKEIKKMAERNVRVLKRWELEEYLYDPKVIVTFLKTVDCNSNEIEKVLKERERLLDEEPRGRVKNIARSFVQFVLETTDCARPSMLPDEFAIEYLVPALKKTNDVFALLREDIFGLQA